MERIYLKPVCQEILHRETDGLSVGQTGKEGYLDLFAYDYDADEDKRNLGNLYLVGNVHSSSADKNSIQTPDKEKTDENDIAYVTNLVASLAKREYYSNPDIASKEAFSLALKKINDVVEEFFINKDIQVNIGIFAIAGEQINISKLGKFKIILSREGKNIDILNNIDLFTKERVQEKEFSHIVSGKVANGDKIFAYYPSRFVTARERYFKEYLIKLTADEFAEKINAIKKERPDFSCAALHIDLNESKESITAKSRKTTLKPSSDSLDDSIITRKKIIDSEMLKPTMEKLETQLTVEKSPDDVPQIIRSEFSLGKKQNIFQSTLNKLGPFMPRFKNRTVLFVVLLAIIIGSALTVKSLFILNPNEKQTASAIEKAEESLRLAETKINQNDIFGARQILTGSISSLVMTPSSSEKTEKTKAELIKALDSLDQAVEIAPILVESLPDYILQKTSLHQTENKKLELNDYNIINPIDFDTYENNLYVLTTDNLFKVSDIDSATKKEASSWLKSGTLPPESRYLAVDGKIYALSKSGILAEYYRGEKTGEYNTSLIPGETGIFATTKDSKNLYLINKELNRIYIINKETGSLYKTLKIGSNEPIIEAYLNQDDIIYFSTADGRFWKIQ
ncbi:MAG: hypothetical protein COV30_01850 [Candidatus Yanofskybacteria bacterium CG10_big_fil_rev_8_21_14_0_10_37_15]|uniref:Uncharacterized protein n=1 Tax=Candidatus Yanofskybacteria bacterium CG10_big_fil_rev_8_21_14_0_10_37_15 TaxID=1975097 RepID=A0A2H0R5I5_9BACT|nr:MAG: hypothetical protein COV30_01850 [Candidatus Yanofskybacteria bacterium CG10_big_fil_rev_8_21_14_0_10_37_15]